MKGNPTLLELLEAGCKVTFPSGYSLRGDTKTKYICLSHEFGGDGLRDLSLQGVKESLQDEEKYRKEREEE